MGLPLPGAHTAFKPKPAPATGIKAQQVGNVKFPGKIAELLPPVKLSGFSNAMIGAALAALAGRIANLVPGLSSAGLARDASIGAAVTIALDKMVTTEAEQNEANIYNARPSSPVENHWRLM